MILGSKSGVNKNSLLLSQKFEQTTSSNDGLQLSHKMKTTEKEKIVSKGMSRASKKRRSEATKQQTSSSSSSSKKLKIDSDCDSDDEEVEEEFGNKERVDKVTGHKQDKKKKKLPSTSSHQSHRQQEIDEKLQHEENEKEDLDETECNRSLTKILSFKEIIEVSSEKRAAMLLSSIISPTKRSEFYLDYWEKKPLICQRDATSSSSSIDKIRFKAMFSKKSFDKLIKEHSLIYAADVDVSKFEKGNFVNMNNSINNSSQNKSNKHNDSYVDDDDEEDQLIEAKAKDLHRYFDNDCAIRLNCPQKYDDDIWRLLSALEPEFGTKVGCQAYLKPAGVQGFPPRYDAFDSFILQLEGRCKWKLYPSKKEDRLPRYPMEEGETVDISHISESIDIILEAGDSLYVPKGWIYHSECCAEEYSLYLSISTNETNSFADYLDLLLPQAMNAMVTESINFRKSLPRGYLHFMGVAGSENDEDPKRKHFEGKVKSCFTGIIDRSVDLIDAAADQMAKQFIIDRLPIPLTDEEEQKTSASCTNEIIQPYTMLRMLRPGIARALVEDGMIILYHCMDNSRENYVTPISPLEFELDDGPAIEMLLQAYPDAVSVSDLPHPSEEIEDKVGVAQALFKEGFLVIEDSLTQTTTGDTTSTNTNSKSKQSNKKKKKNEEKEKRKGESEEEEEEEDEDDSPF